MPSNDPTNTGGLFIGRRPGSAPLRYRAQPVAAGAGRRRLDSILAALILVAETLLCATVWGPQPAGWLWVGAQVYHQTDAISFGILVAFVGMLVTIFGTISLAMRLDGAWKLVRRASGHEQKKGALDWIFVVGMVLAGSAFIFWFLIIQGPLPDLAPRG
jgi:hypothetical protein